MRTLGIYSGAIAKRSAKIRCPPRDFTSRAVRKELTPDEQGRARAQVTGGRPRFAISPVPPARRRQAAASLLRWPGGRALYCIWRPGRG
jgi:hypothetical protein